MNRPSISLCCILKNEVENLPRLLESVKNCFDEIHLTDTGSTDGSVEIIQSWLGNANPANSKIFLHHFEWCQDFGKARQFSFDQAHTDYIMWLDLDDVLVGREAFISWRDTVMQLCDAWMATYHYAETPEGKPICSFARERVIRRNCGMKWHYFVHEGLSPDPKRPVAMQYALVWSVQHKRSAEDLKKDRSRNLQIFEKNKDKLDARMRYYYGKELFENGKAPEAFVELINAVSMPELGPHDRVMGIQYACFAAMHLNQLDRAVQLAFQGLQLDPLRAEFYVTIADCMIKQGKDKEAKPYYAAATHCGNPTNSKVQGLIFQNDAVYTHYPFNQLAKISLKAGDVEGAEEYSKKAVVFGANSETAAVCDEVIKVKEKLGQHLKVIRKNTDDVVFTGLPYGFYEWDGEIYRQKGVGGSETACVEMAEWLQKLTSRRVIVFNNRTAPKTVNGVEYLPASDAPLYFATNKPKVHVAWRHSTCFTEVPDYVWSHDLGFAQADHSNAYKKVLALSPFHKDFLKNMFGVAEEQIVVTRNGIDPTRFAEVPKKDGKKIVFSSSPDRGLDRAILVMDEVVKTHPEVTLHAYYGFDNLKKNGKLEEVQRLEKMISERPYVVFHGNVTQKELTEELQTASLWLYPTNFLETYCITAIEALCSGVYPIVRKYGALTDTLFQAEVEGMATIVDRDCVTNDDIQFWALQVRDALDEKFWERVKVNPRELSWESVAKSWMAHMEL